MSDTGKGVRGKLDEDENKSETGRKMTGTWSVAASSLQPEQ